MRTIRKTSLAVLLLSVSALCLAFPKRPQPERLVNDLAGLFTSAQISSLESMLVAFDDSTSNQIAVVTVGDLEGDTPASFAYRIGEQWGVGDEGFNNGIVVVVKPKAGMSEGKVSIQVGYGLEGAIPDLYCKRIIEGTMIPHFKEGDYYSGVVEACEDLMALASGEISEERRHSSAEEDLEELLVRLLVFFLVMYVLIKLLNRRNGNGGGRWRSGTDFGRHVYIGPIDGWGDIFLGGGSHGGGPGSFGGGGFGGFGGGHFGGGGASGSW